MKSVAGQRLTMSASICPSTPADPMATSSDILWDKKKQQRIRPLILSTTRHNKIHVTHEWLHWLNEIFFYNFTFGSVFDITCFIYSLMAYSCIFVSHIEKESENIFTNNMWWFIAVVVRVASDGGSCIWRIRNTMKPFLFNWAAKDDSGFGDHKIYLLSHKTTKFHWSKGFYKRLWNVHSSTESFQPI